MINENQIVQVKWGKGNKKRYEALGYKFTAYGDLFNVKVSDLPDGSHVRVHVICDYCGEQYEAAFYNVNKSRKILYKDACSNCKYKKNSEVSLLKNATKAISKARKLCETKGLTLLTTEDNFTGVKMTLDIRCSKHGYQNVNMWALFHGAGCPQCAREYVASTNMLDVDYVEQYINSINGNVLLNKNDYKTRKTHNLDIRCSCGNIYTTSFECYLAGVQQCYSCSCKESKREKEIRLFLEAHNISFVQEKKFDDCKDINSLPFDFYLPDYNLVIEFDGQHHFKNVDNMADYEITVKHDKIKNEYCMFHNIDLLRIPYWEGNNIEKILKEKLSL